MIDRYDDLNDRNDVMINIPIGK